MIRCVATIAIVLNSALCVFGCAPAESHSHAAGTALPVKRGGVSADGSRSSAEIQDMSDGTLASSLGYKPIRHAASVDLIRKYYRNLTPRPLDICVAEYQVGGANVACGTIDGGSGVPAVSVLVYLFDPTSQLWRLSYYRPSDGRANVYTFDVSSDAIRVLSPIVNSDGKSTRRAVVVSLPSQSASSDYTDG